ncbi:MAG: CopG family transcriptional regulator [Balneolales bacterium]
MKRTQIYLTQKADEALKTIARRTGKTKSQLIREALDEMVYRYEGEDQHKAFEKAKGLWKDRNDLPDFKKIRQEMDRYS